MPTAFSTELIPHAKEHTAVFQVRGPATFEEAPELRRSLLEAVDATDKDNLVVELDEVERMDTAAMAVLVEALIATRDRPPQLFLVAPNPAVHKVFRLAGLEDALMRCFGCLDDVSKEIGP